MIRQFAALCLVVCSGLWLFAPAQIARACTGLECGPDQFLPRDGVIPANLAAIAWWSGTDWVRSDSDGGTGDQVGTTAKDLIFECKDFDGASRAIPFEVGMGKYAFTSIRRRATRCFGNSASTARRSRPSSGRC